MNFKKWVKSIQTTGYNGVSMVYQKGCAGAVWQDGTPSEEYCKGANGKYPWWSRCCYWQPIEKRCLYGRTKRSGNFSINRARH